ncbi:hypothetical protein ACQP1G_20835 [Nocardia sp. CA-107356]|uniref:hypothetical protein n=1 Tax=Nocardia sp. CA-107356 TaxID=3239972 RepID=UPI003D94702E
MDKGESIAGLPHNRDVDPEQVREAFHALRVPADAVICPWPDDESVDRAVAEAELIVIRRTDAMRVVITPDAKAALTRSPLGGDLDRQLHRVSHNAFRHSRAQGLFSAYLEGGNPYKALIDAYQGLADACTALAVMRPHRRSENVVVTLWSQVCDTVLAIDRGQQEWVRVEIGTDQQEQDKRDG